MTTLKICPPGKPFTRSFVRKPRQLLPMVRPDVAEYSSSISRGETPAHVQDAIKREQWDFEIATAVRAVKPFKFTQGWESPAKLRRQEWAKQPRCWPQDSARLEKKFGGTQKRVYSPGVAGDVQRRLDMCIELVGFGKITDQQWLDQVVVYLAVSAGGVRQFGGSFEFKNGSVLHFDEKGTR